MKTVKFLDFSRYNNHISPEMSKDFILITSRNNKINITAYGENNPVAAPCIICVHGFKGFKDWGFWPYSAEYFSSNGYFVLTFNFSHNGIGAEKDEFTELDKFAGNTISLEIEELKEVYEAWRSELFGREPGSSKTGLLGHSRGGGIALLTASLLKDLSAVCVWGSVSKFDRYTKRQIEEWRKTGKLEVINSRTNQVMRLNLSLLEDIESKKYGDLNIRNAVKKLQVPLLIVHGEQDLTVPVKEAVDLYEWGDKQKTSLLKIPAAGHTFDAVHPFAGSNNKLNNVLLQSEQFFKTNLF